jgi:hypothetical protein
LASKSRRILAITSSYATHGLLIKTKHWTANKL